MVCAFFRGKGLRIHRDGAIVDQVPRTDECRDAITFVVHGGNKLVVGFVGWFDNPADWRDMLGPHVTGGTADMLFVSLRQRIVRLRTQAAGRTCATDLVHLRHMRGEANARPKSVVGFSRRAVHHGRTTELNAAARFRDFDDLIQNQDFG